MWCRTVMVVLILTGRILGEELDKNIKEGKELDVDQEPDNEKWHAVGHQQDSEDWVPSTATTDEEPIVKRRRPGRKRKRRPQSQLEREFLPEDDGGSDRDERLQSRPRGRRPQRLDTRRDNWRDEMMAEEPFRPVRNYNRRRLYPKFDEEAEKIRDPYTALNQEQSSTRRRKKKPEETAAQSTDLKTLLKQSGGISLSELLQQRNLSLADLLKGEQQAISALTTENYENRRRLPPINIKHKNEEEITTERRIFVPSHPKYYTSVDYKPNMKDLNINKITADINTTPLPITEQTSESISVISSTVTFSTSENPNLKNKTKPRSRLPPTYAKLKNLANKTNNYQKTSTLPAKAIKININELFGVTKVINATTPAPLPETTEGPMKIQLLHKSIQNENTKKELTAKDEIMEIISDTASKANLTKLLELRNMTLDELVEQRERGSSQRHLADIFHNKTKEPEASDEIIVDQLIDKPNIFDTFPKFNNKIKHYYSTESKRESRENNDDYNSINNYKPIWKQAYTNVQNGQILDDLIIEDELTEPINDDNEFLRLPYGVRSAIVASAVIIGISLIIFLTIFIIFKWSQRHKTRTNYINSFNNSKIKTPILQTPYQRRIFANIMNATLGRKKKIPTISSKNPQNLHEYLWDTNRKPFQ